MPPERVLLLEFVVKELLLSSETLLKNFCHLQKHLSQFTLENVPNHKFTLNIVPEYEYAYENLSNVNKQLIVTKLLNTYNIIENTENTNSP